LISSARFIARASPPTQLVVGVVIGVGVGIGIDVGMSFSHKRRLRILDSDTDTDSVPKGALRLGTPLHKFRQRICGRHSLPYVRILVGPAVPAEGDASHPITITSTSGIRHRTYEMVYLEGSHPLVSQPRGAWKSVRHATKFGQSSSD
jgi:hypothetical protein